MAIKTYKTRTNYVHITDEERFREIVRNCSTETCEEVTVITHTDAAGNKVFGFQVAAPLLGYIVDKTGSIVKLTEQQADGVYEMNFNAFIADLQSVIAPDDALVIMWIGSNNLKMLNGGVYIITHDAIQSHSLENMALATAKHMLGNNEWHTQMYY